MTHGANPFASRTIALHLARGIGAMAFAVLAGWFISAPAVNLAGWRGAAAIASVGAACSLLRGCPMCWIIGLAGTIANTAGRAMHHE